jgi:PTS system mannose-specific IID component
MSDSGIRSPQVSDAVRLVSGNRITRGDLCHIFFRAFFSQAIWNFQRMQNLGWLFALWPALRRLYPDPAVRSRLAREHLEYFNTHPYMTNVILGVAAGLEERYASGEISRRDDVLAAKKFMSGPLAALGETLFWATFRPLFAVLAVVLGWFFVSKSWWMVPALFLIFYNSLHFLARAGGLAAGYRWMTEVVVSLMRLNLQKIAHAASFLGIGVSFGGVLVLIVHFGPNQGAAVLFLAAALAAFRWGASPGVVLYLILFLSVAFEFLAGGS